MMGTMSLAVLDRVGVAGPDAYGGIHHSLKKMQNRVFSSRRGLVTCTNTSSYEKCIFQKPRFLGGPRVPLYLCHVVRREAATGEYVSLKH